MRNLYAGAMSGIYAVAKVDTNELRYNSYILELLIGVATAWHIASSAVNLETV